ncbi:MAG: DUF1295 domain-containing protein [Gammaproteobacteria bacterium]|nr:DUF1295 domain-containing protein [Gammaproteobacteria bacterium]
MLPFTSHKSIAFLVLPLTAIFGIGSLACFMVFLYSGPFNWVKLDLTEAQGMVLNTLLSFCFFFQHSGMVRRSFRRQLESIIPPHYQGVTYTIISGLVLFVFLVLWQGSDTVLLNVQGLPEIIMRSFFFLAILGSIWGMWALRFVDLFGLDAVARHQKAESSEAKPFTLRGPYRWVRHPLYLFTIIFFWSYPVITSDRLLFNILWTIWVIVGARLEEQELVEDFGDEYREYQSKVPMLFPRSFRPV